MPAPYHPAVDEPVPPATHEVSSWPGRSYLPTAAAVILALQKRKRPLGECSGWSFLEIPSVGKPEVAANKVTGLFTQRGLEFLGGPDEKLALFTLAIGILGRVEPAPWVGHLSEHVIEGLFGYAAVQRAPGDLVGV